ncbi:hypothetical protein Y919_06355 [Caloranaerobacter azorensis H53214]|uniref:YbhG-like alpha-helical hairpin domain-containing protein n=1 Tax=Caloranaerobacter azorensis H53214 TaxID=1156417 RepID=A0A096CV60_9FIRM|nr:efflux RND transporter periplasmic adaptor subunit [Caloranaerobacter azorensis]KGG80434.1 hypothetical protein Y919_06355 [Caloranaerobacter azorensis H53214]
MRKVFIIVMFLISFLFVSCTDENNKNISKPKIKPVKVIEVKEEVRDKELKYLGVVTAEEVKKFGFKVSGKIQKIYVQKGSKVKKGMILAKLDTKELELSVKAVQFQMKAAKSQYDKISNGATEEEVNKAKLNLDKAKEAYEFANENYEKIKRLYEEGAVSKSELDKAELEFNIRKTEFNQANEVYKQVLKGGRYEDKDAAYANYEQAKVNYEYKKSLLEGAKIVADTDGYVVDVLYKEGELVSQGMPVVIIRNRNQVVRVGLSQKDVNKVKLGDKAIIRLDDENLVGVITNIDDVPDNQTRTYSVDVALNGRQLQIGSIVKVGIIVGRERGIFIPISTIMTNGEDYVYVVKGDRVIMKKIRIVETCGDRVMVEGLENGDKLVIENIKQIRPDDRVKIVD